MKKIYKLLYILLVTATLSSCTDFLDLPPKNERSVEGLEDIKAVFSGYLNGVATKFAGTIVGPSPIYYWDALNMFAAYSDDIDFSNAMPSYINPAQTYNHKKYADFFLWNDYTTPEVIWNQYYEVIGFLNALVDQTVAVTDADQGEKDQIEGELRAHRAFYIFKLLQYFAPYDQAEMGIPVYLHSGEQVVGIKNPRKSQAEVYKIILDDLLAAKEMLARTDSKSTFNLFYTESNLNNLIAQVYWFKAESSAKEDTDYENAKLAAIDAINGVQAVIPTTSAEFIRASAGTLTDYPGVFQQSRNYGILNLFSSPWAAYGYLPANIPMNPDLLGLYTADDIRTPVMINTSNGTVHPNWPDNAKYGIFTLFQPEEAYLILAEANYRIGNEGDCISVLNEFKSFRNTTTATGLSGESLLQEVLNERRMEFFGTKDMRWLDLKRYGNKTVSRNVNLFDTDYSIVVEPNSYRYALPIPLTELAENPDIIPNEGWVLIEYNN